jgi:hypothetical protein
MSVLFVPSNLIIDGRRTRASPCRRISRDIIPLAPYAVKSAEEQ